jgi:hypothetical protein
MSFGPAIHKAFTTLDPAGGKLFGGKADLAFDAFGPKTPPAPPGVPNPNDAANAAQSTTDAMRMRRGMLSNIYAGSQAGQPVTGKTQLGS